MNVKRCPRFPDVTCPADPCPCADLPHSCALGNSLIAIRENTARIIEAERLRIPDKIRDAVNDCPYRGGVLPISMQEDCGCAGRELSACAKGLGTIPGRVTLNQCISCVSR